MKKIPTIYQRDPQTHHVIDEPNPEAAWVFAGEGRATRKYDGTAVLIEREGSDTRVYKRFAHKAGRPVPDGFLAAEDAIGGDIPGWLPFDAADPGDRWLKEALDNPVLLLTSQREPEDLGGGPTGWTTSAGTYELCGPKVQGNPEGFARHTLVRHGARLLEEVPLDFEGLRRYLETFDVEGIVWHHPDGRMAKLKARDFGIPRFKPAPVAVATAEASR